MLASLGTLVVQIGFWIFQLYLRVGTIGPKLQVFLGNRKYEGVEVSVLSSSNFGVYIFYFYLLLLFFWFDNGILGRAACGINPDWP